MPAAMRGTRTARVLFGVVVVIDIVVIIDTSGNSGSEVNAEDDIAE